MNSTSIVCTFETFSESMIMVNTNEIDNSLGCGVVKLVVFTVLTPAQFTAVTAMLQLVEHCSPVITTVLVVTLNSEENPDGPVTVPLQQLISKPPVSSLLNVKTARQVPLDTSHDTPEELNKGTFGGSETKDRACTIQSF